MSGWSLERGDKGDSERGKKSVRGSGGSVCTVVLRKNSGALAGAPMRRFEWGVKKKRGGVEGRGRWLKDRKQ